ncbi:serine--tRNA ligase, mitochondrial [Tribolium madens]|uniref:serine--tRNA ligase, mitochondrial n=1 Tax=Tribolium madens TaxID=41895 RepID=UPI001CF73506|nr:serine--tRNA ligase, mitochondrial [Tribolium madens]
MMFSRKVATIRVFFPRHVYPVSRSCHTTAPQGPHLDIQYLCDPKNITEISQNIANRKGIGNIQRVHELNNQLQALNRNDKAYEPTRLELVSEALKIPNRTHPHVSQYGDSPKTVTIVGAKPPDGPHLDFQEICKKLRLLRTDQLGNFSGSKSYYLLGEMAELEHALIRYVTSNLIKKKFELVSVPDILPRGVIEGCGMNTRGARTQVYALDEALHGPDLCLSGTSEMALAGYLAQKTLNRDFLPLRLAAVSRCYRAETSNLLEERGIYRVHEFTKVEMFVVTQPQDSDRVLEEILGVEMEVFGGLGLHFQVLDMPPCELGAQAYRKYDIEAWMPGRGLYGEISSCSNCLDYQARRLGIRTHDGFVHTLNGTACAIPRLLIALVEMGQRRNGTVEVPEVLWPHMGGKKLIGKQKHVPELRLIKNKKV